ncbi:MAG: nucleotidyltransferase [Chloroflexota bacterium]
MSTTTTAISTQPGHHPTLAEQFYMRALDHVLRSGVPFMVGGAYSLREYAGICRDTKDLDLFCKAEDYPRILQVLADAGFRTEITFPHWLAKAFENDLFVDVIFNTPNAVCPVNDGWLEHAPVADVLGHTVKLVPPEEVIWPKLYLMERERFDGADVLHIIRHRGPTLDWRRLWSRMDRHWEVLLAHLLLFDFVYPSERAVVPEWLMRELASRLEQHLVSPPSEERICRGLLLSDRQYQIDITQWGYQDIRALLLQGRTG